MKVRTLALVVAGISTVLLALPIAAAPDSACPGDEGGPGHHRMMHDPAKMQQFATHHLGKLHDKLKLSTEQEAAWKTYSDAVNAQLATIAKTPPPDRCAMHALSTPDRMDKMLEHAKLHQQMLEQRIAYTKPFYAQLTADQKKVFDELAVPHRPDGRRGGHHHGGGRHGDGPGPAAPN